MTITKAEFLDGGVRRQPTFRQRYLRAYRYWRKLNYKAPEALSRAKVEAFQGVDRWPSTARKGTWNPKFEAYGERHMRWIESPANCGLRFVGHADEITSLGHTGWYTDDYGCGEIVRGAVYQLPGRNGKPQFVYGYDDPYNPDAACLSFDVLEGEPDFFSTYASDNPEAGTAACWADGIAERLAKSEREYNRVWQAGRSYEDKGEELVKLRTATLDLIRQFKKFRAGCAAFDLSECVDAIYDRISDNVAEMCKLKSERAELLYDYGDYDGFVE